MRALPALALMLASGCGAPVDDTYGGVEITGYLDSARVSVTATGVLGATPIDAWVVGQPGAATDLDSVTVDNQTLAESFTGVVRDDGAFSVEIQLAEGDALSIGGQVEAPIEIEQAVVHGPLAPTTLDATRDGANVDVVVAFDSAPGFHLALSVPATGAWSELAAESDVHFTGSVPAAEGETILFYGFIVNPPDATAATSIVAPP